MVIGTLLLCRIQGAGTQRHFHCFRFSAGCARPCGLLFMPKGDKGSDRRWRRDAVRRFPGNGWLRAKNGALRVVMLCWYLCGLVALSIGKARSALADPHLIHHMD